MKNQITSIPNARPPINLAQFSDDPATILHVLKCGKVATVPTETVEGYAVMLSSTPAIKSLMALKDRDYNSGKVFTLVPESPHTVSTYAIIPPRAEPLVSRYLPGELTLILPRNPAFHHFYYDHFDAIGIRIPDHPLFQQILPLTGPLLLTSANPRGGIPRSCTGHHPSTIVDFTTPTPHIIRQGNLKVKL